MGLAEGPVLVRVPATSANLGPGFDALGLALGLHDEIEARVAGSGLSLEVSGESADDVAGAGERHLIVRAMRVAFDALDVAQPAGLALRCVNRIPHGRGLGSSAAAIVAGLLAARALAGASVAPGDVLPLASELEGHPDNVAPCLLGGLTIAWTAESKDEAMVEGAMLPPMPCARAVRLEPLPEVRPVVFVAPESVSTKVARGLLPATVPHGDAARNAGARRAARRGADEQPWRAVRRDRGLAAPGLPRSGDAALARTRHPAAGGRRARGHLRRGPVGSRVPRGEFWSR